MSFTGKKVTMTNAKKTFPIQANSSMPDAVAFQVPWVMAERAYDRYGRLFGNIESLEEIAERGGFEWANFVLLYCGKSPSLDYTVNTMTRCTHMVVVDLLSGMSTRN